MTKFDVVRSKCSSMASYLRDGAKSTGAQAAQAARDISDYINSERFESDVDEILAGLDVAPDKVDMLNRLKIRSKRVQGKIDLITCLTRDNAAQLSGILAGVGSRFGAEAAAAGLTLGISIAVGNTLVISFAVFSKRYVISKGQFVLVEA